MKGFRGEANNNLGNFQTTFINGHQCLFWYFQMMPESSTLENLLVQDGLGLESSGWWFKPFNALRDKSMDLLRSTIKSPSQWVRWTNFWEPQSMSATDLFSAFRTIVTGHLEQVAVPPPHLSHNNLPHWLVSRISPTIASGPCMSQTPCNRMLLIDSLSAFSSNEADLSRFKLLFAFPHVHFNRPQLYVLWVA